MAWVDDHASFLSFAFPKKSPYFRFMNYRLVNTIRLSIESGEKLH